MTRHTPQCHHRPSPEVTAFCREPDVEAPLELLGAPRGECVTMLQNQANEEPTSFIARLCGHTSVQEQTHTKTKGQCI